MLILIFLVASLDSVYVAFVKQDLVTFPQIETYANIFIHRYNQSLSFFYPETFNLFNFYSNESYEVTAVISSKYGTAIIFKPSDTYSFKTVQTDIRVEDAILGKNNSQLPTRFSISHDQGIFMGNWFNVGFTVDENASLMIGGASFNSVYYYCLIMKGNNLHSSWDSDKAILDANHLFDSNLYAALNQSEAIRERYAEPELSELTAKVKTKWANAIDPSGAVIYTPSQKEHDIKEIEDIARTKYHITNSSAFVQSILDFFEYVQLPTPPPEKAIFTVPMGEDVGNWKYVTICVFFPSWMYLFYSLLDYVRKKHPSNDVRYWVEIVTWIVVVPLSASLYAERAYDYQIISIQTAVIVIFGIVCAFMVHKTKHWLATWFATRKSKKAKEETENKTE